jgi:hypothetical protein
MKGREREEWFIFDKVHISGEAGEKAKEERFFFGQSGA